MEEVSVYDYAIHVHRVLMEPNVIMGIGIMPAMLILILTIVLMNLVSIWTSTIGIGMFMTAKLVCKKDPYMLEILLERLMIPDIWSA